MNKATVSVIVVTYNSSKFIEETLNSVLNQTWKQIELIITDDHSTDRTVELCRDWISKNEAGFIRTEIVTTDKNTGVTRNANRGLKAAKGDWIKTLGGDDTLLPDCIEKNMRHVNEDEDEEIKVLFSSVNVYRGTFDPSNFVKTIPGEPFHPAGIFASGRSADSQHRMLLGSDRIHFTPSAFIHRKTLLQEGGYDEQFRMIEDYPLWLRFTSQGLRLYFFDEETVNYRIHDAALVNNGQSELIQSGYFEQEEIRRKYTYPYLPSDIRMLQRFNWIVLQVFRIQWVNRRNHFSRFLYSLLSSYLNPFKYLVKIRKRLYMQVRNSEYYHQY